MKSSIGAVSAFMLPGAPNEDPPGGRISGAGSDMYSMVTGHNFDD